MKRYAIVKGRGVDAAKVSAYLPSNYKVIFADESGVVIEGIDRNGWTIEKYVVPRLGSGMMACQEIDLSHPVMKKIPQ